MNYKFAVLGLGQLGKSVALSLARLGAEVIAADIKGNVVDEVKDEVAFAVTLDATDKKSLLAQNIQDTDAVVVAIGENFESLLLTTVLLQELKIKRIISRANGERQRTILQKLGIREILSPEKDIGIIVSEKLLHPEVISFMKLSDEYEITELLSPEGIVGRQLGDISLSEKYHLSIIAIKRTQIDNEKNVIITPASKTEIQAGDHIVVFGKMKDIERFIEINN